MRNVILYVAMSLDGYLADETGGLDWLHGENPEELNQWYEEFYDSVDCILMGKRTYQQIAEELSPEFWIYGGKQSYVFTSTAQEEQPDIQFTQKQPGELVKYLKHRKGKDIWICGGAQLISTMIQEDLVDEYHITIIPTLLGGGIPLFPQGNPPKRLSLQSSRCDNGMVDLVYR